MTPHPHSYDSDHTRDEEIQSLIQRWQELEIEEKSLEDRLDEIAKERAYLEEEARDLKVDLQEY